MERQVALEELATVLGLDSDSIDLTNSFAGCGGHSISALQFVARCRSRNVRVAVDSVLASPNLNDVLKSCHVLIPEPPTIDKALDVDSTFADESVPPTNSTDRQVISFEDISDSMSMNLTPSARSSDVDPTTTTTTPELASPYLPGIPGRETCHNWCTISLEQENICSLGKMPEAAGDLTEMQLSLIHGSIQSPGTNVIHYYEEQDTSDLPRLKLAWLHTLRHESIFSIAYRNPEDGCWLVPKFYWRQLETSNTNAYEALSLGDTDSLPQWSEQDVPIIDLGVRFTVATLRKGWKSATMLIWSVHHALIDGWSAMNLINKVRRATAGFSTAPGPSFQEWAVTLEQYRAAHEDEGTAFWRKQHQSLLAAKHRPLLHAPTSTQESQAQLQSAEISLSLPRRWPALEQAAKECSVTMATLVHAAWAITLSLYTDSENVMFGVVLSGRNLPVPGILDVVGPVLNTLPLQLHVARDGSVRNFVTAVFKQLQELSHFAWTLPSHGFTRSFESVLGVQMEPSQNSATGDTDTAAKTSFSQQTTNIPISIIIGNSGRITLQFSSAQYYNSHMHALGNCFQAVLASLAHLDMSIATCMRAGLSPESLLTLRQFGNCESGWTTRACSSDDLVTLFESAVFKNPQVIALKNGAQELTYDELDNLSGVVARELVRLGVKPEEVVTVHADGSVNWIVATWGVLRAGATYCPIDKSHPQAVRDTIFGSCNARYFLATATEACATKTPSTARAIDVGSILANASTEAESGDQYLARRNSARPCDRAYVCFTSGSTGKPKGVMCTHEGLVAFQRDLEVRLFAAPGRKIAQFMSAAFDGSIHEVFSSLCYGATLLLRDEVDPMGHLKEAESAILTPSIALHLDPVDFSSLKTVYLVGEAVSQVVCDKWASRKTVYNMYGPTEGTCGATITRLYPGRPVTIGRPNPSTRVYILDKDRQLAPVGREGEVWLAGVQIAQGYIGQPELTAERFHPDTICKGLGESMYRTGDHGYWNEDGEIIFLGRLDRLVKVRGFRVDLDDLETRVLQCCPGVRAVAVACKDKTDIVCMLEASHADPAELREHITKALPTYAVPRFTVIVDKLPTNRTGKVDYTAVIKATVERGRRIDQDQPSTPTEKELAVIWGTVLELNGDDEPITTNSSFIELGGHSLRQLRLVSKASTQFGTPVHLRTILERPTLRELAKEIDRLRAIKDRSDNTSECRLTISKPSLPEVGWWRRYQWDRGGASFNVSFVCRYDSKSVVSGKLKDAWDVVLARYNILRSRYVHRRKGGLERSLSPNPPVAEKVSSVDVWQEVNRPMDIETGQPVRVLITDNLIVAVWSHIICDYTTLHLLLADVSAVYCGHPLSASVPNYHEAPAWNTPPAQCSLQFWGEHLKGADHIQTAVLGNNVGRTSYSGTSSTVRVPAPLWHRMSKYVSDGNITAQQLVLAAVALAASSDQSSMDITLGTPFINRRTEEDMHTVGLFLEPLPIRIAFQDVTQGRGDLFPPAPSTCQDYLAAVQSLAQQALSHAVPWSSLLEHLDIDLDELMPDHPLFDCVVSFHDLRKKNGASTSAANGWHALDLGSQTEPQLVWSQGSKFKLMIEFYAISDDLLLLRFEYDENCYNNPEHIAAARRMLLKAINMIVPPNEGLVDPTRHASFAAVSEQLKQTWLAEKESGFSAPNKGQLELASKDGYEDLFQIALA